MSTINQFDTTLEREGVHFSLAEPSSVQVSPTYSSAFLDSLEALYSFFNIENHPLPESELLRVSDRDWSFEMHIAAGAVLHCINLLWEHKTRRLEDSRASEEAGHVDGLSDLCDPDYAGENGAGAAELQVANELCMLYATVQNMARNGSTDSFAFSSLALAKNRLSLGRDELIGHSKRRPAEFGFLAASLPTGFLAESSRARDDVCGVIDSILDLLQLLEPISDALRSDQPLKQTLTFFALIYDRARQLMNVVERVARSWEANNHGLFETFDALKFAISMELRKVYGFELVGLSSSKQAPSIFAKVENAHGLLRDAFQQSIVNLGRLFDPGIEGSAIFETFHARLDQSVALRKDLWALLNLVWQAEKGRDQFPIISLIERLETFRKSSMKFLMFKDWEACERFMEEVGAARGAIELAPVLNRFSAYLETLHGQVSMRAVLADCPFDYDAETVR